MRQNAKGFPDVTFDWDSMSGIDPMRAELRYDFQTHPVDLIHRSSQLPPNAKPTTPSNPLDLIASCYRRRTGPQQSGSGSDYGQTIEVSES